MAKLKTIRAICNDSGFNYKLAKAVIRQLGGCCEDVRTNLRDVCSHGADTGWGGFCYYCDTVSFFKRNKKEILALVNQQAEDFGVNPAEFVAGFNCLKFNDSKDKYYHENMAEVYRALDGRVNRDDCQVANALAWFALEECARAFNPDL